MIREVHSEKGAICAEILAALPHWFGMPESNAAYVRDVESLPMFAALDEGRVAGFIAIKEQTPHAYEIHVLGVRPELHRKGFGRALVTRSEAVVRSRGAQFLTVKTLAPSRFDEGYARTRAFYVGLGFLPIEEFPTLWNPENPALLMLKVLA